MRTLLAGFAALVLAGPAVAQDPFDFEDLALPPINATSGLGLVQQEIGAYRGYDFFGIGAMSSAAPIFGTPAAASSGVKYAFVGSEGLGALYRFDLRGFDFFSAFLSFQPSGGQTDPAQIIIRGFRTGDTELASFTRSIALTSTVTRYDFDFRNLEQLEFETVAGVGFLAIDDLNVATVPEPATMLLFGSGLAGLAGLHLRRRRAA